MAAGLPRAQKIPEKGARPERVHCAARNHAAAEVQPMAPTEWDAAMFPSLEGSEERHWRSDCMPPARRTKPRK